MAVVGFGGIIDAPRARAVLTLTCRLNFLNDFGSTPQNRKKVFMAMKQNLRPLPLILLTTVLGLTPPLGATPNALSIDAPSFIIPLGGQSGTLDLYSDGRPPETTGFNSLGRQQLTVLGNSVSSGSLTLNLHFTGFSVDPQAFEVGGASLRATLLDMDFTGGQSGTGGMLHESAVLSSINGVPLSTLMSFLDYLPAGTHRTDNQLLTLDPILLNRSMLPASFGDSLTLSFTLTATLVNSSSRPMAVFNSPEHLVSDLSLTLVPATVPEPSTWVLLGLGGLWLGVAIRRRR